MFAKSATSTKARRLSIVGVLASTLLGVSACGTTVAAHNTAAVVPIKQAGQVKPGGVAANPLAGKARTIAVINYAAGMDLISNGTDKVRIGSQTVTFPTTVTDASWSSDGSRIAFIDANGNVATAHPDGTSLTVLTTKQAGMTRSNPTWFGNLVVFTERDARNVDRMESVTVSGGAEQKELLLLSGDTTADGNLVDTGNSSPSASDRPKQQLDDYGMVAYQHQGADGPEVWIIDYNSRESSGLKVAEGSDPVLSPDDTEVAFVDGKGQIEVMPTFESGHSGSPAQQITFSAADPGDLAWTPDGTRVAFSTASGIESVAADISSKATANPPTVLSTTPGTITFLPAAKGEIDQFTGTDPVALALSASQDRWPSESVYRQSQGTAPARTATLGSASAPDTDLALLSSVDGNGPLLLNNGATLDPRVTAELRRVFGTFTPGTQTATPTVYLLGGTSDIPSSVQVALEHLGYQTVRIASAIPPVSQPPTTFPYASVFRALTRVVLVDSASPADELVGTAYAGYYGSPVLQVAAVGLSPANQTWLSLSSGEATTTALFAPTVGFTGQYIQTITGEENNVLGYTTLINPADPQQVAAF